MTCREALFFVRFRRPGASGAGELAPEDTAALDRHLAACPACLAEANASAAFDASLGSAMRAVEIPSGLRDRLFVTASVERGRRLRRRAYQLTALAASLFLTVGLAAGIFTATRPEPDTFALLMNASRVENTLRFEPMQNVGFGQFEQANANRTALETWLKSERLPPLPQPGEQSFDLGLVVSQHWEEVQERQVPVVLLRGRDGGFAKIYAFRSTQFNLKSLKSEKGVSDSNCQAAYFPTERSGVVYVVVFTGRDLTPFLEQKQGPGPTV